MPVENNGLQSVVDQIKTILVSGRNAASREVNSVMLNTYWEIERTIVEHEQDGVLALSRQGISMSEPQDFLKQPFVFEFLGVRENKPVLESDLEARLIRHIEDFLLELGRGFMFVGSQQRMLIGSEHYYVDMVFYNKYLKAFVLIDLKMGSLKIEHAGQMNAYLNYYRTEVNEPGDNPPIGIILCTAKREVVAEYALGGLSNQVFASEYVYYIPDKGDLVREVKALLDQENM
jgi:predicted nuclease of restriction endonuclease-like (RecB) superfamily